MFLEIEKSRQYFHVRTTESKAGLAKSQAGKMIGFDVTGGNICRFDRGVYTYEMAQAASTLLLGGEIHTDPRPTLYLPKEFVAKEQGAMPTRLLEATDEDLEIINRDHSLVKQTKDSVVIHERYVVNNAPSRNQVWFLNSALEKLAADYAQGRSRLMHHNKTAIVGRTFAADVVKGKTIRGITADWVRLKQYTLKTPANEQLIADVNGGILAFDSVGISGGVIDVKEVEREGQTVYYLTIGYDPNDIPPLEAGEVSYVFLGAIYGAGNDKQQDAPTVDVSGTEQDENSTTTENEVLLWLN